MPLLVSLSSPHSSNKENGAICIRHQTTSKPTCCLPSMLSILHAVALLFFFFSLVWLCVHTDCLSAEGLWCGASSNHVCIRASIAPQHCACVIRKVIHKSPLEVGCCTSGICKSDGNILQYVHIPCWNHISWLFRSVNPNHNLFWKSCTVFSRAFSLMSWHEVRRYPSVSHTNTKG